MPPERWFDECEIAVRVHGRVTDRRRVGDVVVLDLSLPDGRALSVSDPDERYPPGLVGESRTLALAIDGFPDVRPADGEEPILESAGDGRVDLAGRRTAGSAWDGRTLSMPIDVGLDVVSVPVCETTRPSREADADREILAEAGVLDCPYVAAEDVRLCLHAVDLDVDTDPWAGVVYDDVTFAIDLDDERFETAVLERNGREADASMRIALGPRWFLGDADAWGQDDPIDLHLAALVDTLLDVLEGDAARHPFMYAPIAYRFDPIDRDVVRVTLTSGGRCINPSFPPDGATVDVEALSKAVLRASRSVLRRVEELNPAAMARFEELRSLAGSLELELRVRGAL